MTMIQQLYNACSLPLSAAAGPIFLLSARGRARLAERYGGWRVGAEADRALWFHGASAGEIRGLLPLISRLEGERPGLPTLVTATSITGVQAAENGGRICRLMPFDSPLWISRAIGSSRPAAYIQTETELWPAALSVIRRRGIPIFLVNARISDYTAGLYGFLRPLFAPLLGGVSAAFAADDRSAGRLVALGVPAERVLVTGNTKYDRPASVTSEEARHAMRKRLLLDDAPVIVLGSIRPGEERVWIPALREAAADGLRFTVLFVPRHAEKFDYFAAALDRAAIPSDRVSRGCSGIRHGSLRVVLFDEFGALEALYAVASLAFIGASLVDIGGHNPLEACAYGTPVTMGPHDSVVSDLTADLLQAGALFRIERVEDAVELLRRLSADPKAFESAGAAGREVWKRHQGATARVYERLANLLGEGNTR